MFDDSTRLRLLHELGCAFAARTELEDLCRLVISKCGEALHAEGVGILLLDPKTQELFFPYVANEDPAVAEFVSKYEEKFGALPSAYAWGMYASGQMLAQVLENADEKPTGEALVEAIKGLDLSSTIIGGGGLDEYGSPIGPVFVREVVARDDGTLWNAVIETYDDVSQFWTFDPEAYLENPPFSQEFQQQ